MERRVRAVSVLLCCGAGYSARAFARRMIQQGWTVYGSARDQEKKERLARLGIAPILFTGKAPSPNLSKLLRGGKISHLLSSIPPDDKGDPLLRHHGGEIIDARAGGALLWAGYLSTTGVYGDRHGAAVSESSALRPMSDPAKRRACAEASWRGLFRDDGASLHIFRLGGIYGPGRSVLERLRRRRGRGRGVLRIYKAGQFFSRIHRDDIARALEASALSPSKERCRIYNLCDDCPAPASEVLRYGARLLGLPSPPLRPLETLRQGEISEAARRFYRENRRVRNRRLHGELKLRLLYPTYREGLRALAEERESESADAVSRKILSASGEERR